MKSNLEIKYFKNTKSSKIFEVKNMISKDVSDVIIKESEKMSGWTNVGFYKAKILGQIDEHPEIDGLFKDYVKSYINDTSKILSKEFDKNVCLKMIYIQKWPIGSYAVRHNDTHNFDGSPAFVYCKVSTVLYLYNDFLGGNLEFPDHDISIQPNQGSAYMFDGGPENEHQVTEIIDGDRYTIVTFWDFIDSEYTKEDLELSEQSQQRWLKFIKENYD